MPGRCTRSPMTKDVCDMYRIGVDARLGGNGSSFGRKNIYVFEFSRKEYDFNIRFDIY